MFSIQPAQQLKEEIVELDNVKIMALKKAANIGYTWLGQDKARIMVCYDVNCPYCAAEFIDAIYDIAKQGTITVTMVPHFSTQLGSTTLHFLLIDFALNYLQIGESRDATLDMFKRIFEHKVSKQVVTYKDLFDIIADTYKSLYNKDVTLGDFINYLDGLSKNAMEVTPFTVVATTMLQGSAAPIIGMGYFFSPDTFMQTCTSLIQQLTGKQYVVGVPTNIIYDLDVRKAVIVSGKQDKISLMKYKSKLYEKPEKSVITETAEPKASQEGGENKQ